MKKKLSFLTQEIKERKSYVFLILPPLLILLVILSFILVFQPIKKTPPQKISPSPTREAGPQKEPPPASVYQITISPAGVDFNKQDRGDTQFSEEQDKIRRDYPWIEKLPISEKGYFIYFDVQQKSFIGLLYPQSSASATIQEQVDDMKTEAQSKLKSMGINYQNYPFQWTITPEP